MQWNHNKHANLSFNYLNACQKMFPELITGNDITASMLHGEGAVPCLELACCPQDDSTEVIHQLIFECCHPTFSQDLCSAIQFTITAKTVGRISFPDTQHI